MEAVHPPLATALLVGLLGLALGAEASRAEAPAWHPTLEAGLNAAKTSGRPVFLVTIWKRGV